MSAIVGNGSFERPLTEQEIREICAVAVEGLPVDGKKVLVLVPDHTRHAPIGLFFRALHDLLARRTAAFDVLIANGTHAPMSEERIRTHLGLTEGERLQQYARVRFVNHAFNDPAALTTIGRITAAEIGTLTNGLFKEDIPVTINRLVVEYDHLLLVTPVVPHEAVGFAGGNKYFFPGIAGLDVIQTFHWLAAIITNPAVNGVKDTPTRRVVDRAAECINTPRTCFAFAVDDHDRPMCLFAGDPKAAWSAAADYSARLHITYAQKSYRTILALTPPIYEDLWVGGKAMYKLEPVLNDGAELIIYGPQIRSFSFVHDEKIRHLGYHCIEYFTKQWDRFRNEPKLIMAHSSNVRGIGTFQDGSEHPRVNVTLATAIPEDVCRSVNLTYRDPRSVRPEEFRGREHDGVLVVDNAGQNLYRLGKPIA